MTRLMRGVGRVAPVIGPFALWLGAIDTLALTGHTNTAMYFLLAPVLLLIGWCLWGIGE